MNDAPANIVIERERLEELRKQLYELRRIQQKLAPNIKYEHFSLDKLEDFDNARKIVELSIESISLAIFLQDLTALIERKQLAYIKASGPVWPGQILAYIRSDTSPTGVFGTLNIRDTPAARQLIASLNLTIGG